MEINVNIHKFIEQFGNEYEFLYNHHDRVAGYDEAVFEFDRLMETNDSFAQFVKAFVEFRQDYVSSDREAAAFMFALDALS